MVGEAGEDGTYGKKKNIDTHQKERFHAFHFENPKYPNFRKPVNRLATEIFVEKRKALPAIIFGKCFMIYDFDDLRF